MCVCILNADNSSSSHSKLNLLDQDLINEGYEFIENIKQKKFRETSYEPGFVFRFYPPLVSYQNDQGNLVQEQDEEATYIFVYKNCSSSTSIKIKEDAKKFVTIKPDNPNYTSEAVKIPKFHTLKIQKIPLSSEEKEALGEQKELSKTCCFLPSKKTYKHCWSVDIYRKSFLKENPILDT